MGGVGAAACSVCSGSGGRAGGPAVKVGVLPLGAVPWWLDKQQGCISPRSRHQRIRCLVRARSWFVAVFCLCLHVAGGGTELSGVTFIRALITFMTS